MRPQPNRSPAWSWSAAADLQADGRAGTRENRAACRQAGTAAEVKRLQVIEAKALEQSEYIQTHGLTVYEQARLQAEIDALRAALTAIAELPPYGWSAEMCALMQGYARDGSEKWASARNAGCRGRAGRGRVK